MKKSVIIIIAAAIFVLAACNNVTDINKESGKIKVAVSIVPEASFVEAVGGDLVDIVTIIPVGNSPANYQPTTMEMQELSNADIYFIMHVPTEEANILPKVSDFNKDMILVDLRDAVSEEYSLRYMGEHSHGEEEDEHDKHDADDVTVDPHIWLSPKRVAVMVETIADELSKIDAANESIYRANAQKYIDELSELDIEIKEIVDRMDNKSFMIYHGAYGYFADDYGLNMISLESDGKAATAAGMQKVIDSAMALDIKAIFYQDEFDDSQAQTIAEEIGGTVKRAAPLAKDYINSLKSFASALLEDGE